MAALDDEALVARVRAGDRPSTNEFVRRYSALLLKVAGDDIPAAIRGRVGASDVVQEAWIVVLERLATWTSSGTDSLRRWLVGVLRNVLRNRSKREQRNRRSARRDRPLAGANEAGELADPVAMTVELSNREMNRLKEAAETRLPDTARDVLRLVEDEGLHGKALAARLTERDAAARRALGPRRATGADAARKRYERAFAARQRMLRTIADESAAERAAARKRRGDDEPGRRQPSRRAARTATTSGGSSSTTGLRLGPGTRVGRFRVEEHVGDGAMASVYRATVVEGARGLPAGRTVALKVLSERVSFSTAMQQRFRRETDVGRRLRCPHVVRVLGRGRVVLDAEPRRARLYLVSEFVDGEDLAVRVRRDGPLDEVAWRRVALALARGLAAIHGLGAVHRDVKPANVLLARDGGVRLVDLGLARLLDAPRGPTKTGSFVGSLEFAAPEQFRRGGVDARADLYALGVTLFVAATGSHPFPVASGLRGAIQRAARRDAPPRARAQRDRVSPFHDAVIATLMAPEREDRFASAAALVETLAAGVSSAWWRERAALRARPDRSEGAA